MCSPSNADPLLMLAEMRLAEYHADARRYALLKEAEAARPRRRGWSDLRAALAALLTRTGLVQRSRLPEPIELTAPAPLELTVRS